MRALWLSIPVLVVAVSGCDRPQGRAEIKPGQSISIKAAEAPPEPKTPAGDKLAVTDGPPPPRAAPATPRAAPPPPQDDGGPIADPAEPGSDERDWADGPPATVTLRDCRRAARRGAPLADSGVCRGMLADLADRRAERAERRDGPFDGRFDPPYDPQVVDECLQAAREGDPYANGRLCRDALRQY